MSRIFLSHSSANNAEAIAIRDWMIAHGWDDVFLDLDPERGLKSGERWQEALKRAAERCESVVFIVSPVWAASKWCLAEFLLAKSLNKRVFAVIVEPTPFSELPTEMTAEYQITDLTAGTRDFRATVTLPGGKTTEVAFGSEGLNRLRIGLVQSGLDPKYFPWPPANDPDRTPYRDARELRQDRATTMFVRFRQNESRLQVSLVETRRVNGKVRHEHVASFGSVERPPSVEARIKFWQRLHGRLAKLSNRVDATEQAKILGAIHARIPMVTPNEERALQLENAKADERFWSSLHDMHAGTIEDQTGLAGTVERAIAEGQAGMANAAEKRNAAKDRRERLERGEDVQRHLVAA